MTHHSIMTGAAFLGCAIALVLLLAARRGVRGSARADALRNHLTELTRAWLLLCGLYGLQFVLSLLSDSSLSRGVYDHPIDLGEVAVHGIALVVCGITNWLILRSLAPLDSFIEEPVPTQPLWLRLLRVPIRRRTEVRAAMQFAVAISFVVPALLVIVALGPQAARATAIVVGYYVQVAISSGLMGLLALYYGVVLARPVASVSAAAYAPMQLLYPQAVVVSLVPGFWWTLLVVKLWLAGAIAVAAYGMRARLPFGEEASDSLLELGQRWSRLAPRNSLVQRAALLIGAATGFFAVALLREPFLAIIWRRPSDHPRMSWFISVVVAIIATQFGAYFGKRWADKSVPWERLAEGPLKHLLEKPIIESRSGWHSIRLRPRLDFARDHDVVRVILIHGILSHSASCWGLLPAILLDSGRVSEVQLLSYKHTLFSSGRLLESICREFADKLRSEAGAAPGKLVIFAHSLGSLITIRALTHLFLNAEVDAIDGIRHVSCVGTPMTGSKFARAGYPWVWFRFLRPNSSFVRETMAGYWREFPPPGKVVGENWTIPTFTFLRGTRDEVAGSPSAFLGLPDVEVSVVGDHSQIAEIYVKGSREAEVYLQQLNWPTRPAQWLHQLGMQLLGDAESAIGAIFETERDSIISQARVVGVLAPSWGRRLGKPPLLRPNDRPRGLGEFLWDYVHGGDAVGPESAIEESAIWKSFEDCYSKAKDSRTLTTATLPPWTLQVVAIGASGLLLVRRDRHPPGG